MIRKITYSDNDFALLENEQGESFSSPLAEEPLKQEITSLMATSESITVNVTFTKLGRFISDIISITPVKGTKEEPIVVRTLPVMTRSEVAQRVGSDNCCIIIDKKVYNVSSYLPLHPGTSYYLIIRVGGSLIIEALGGKDVTLVLNAIPHSEQAMKDLQKYVVGTVEEVPFVCICSPLRTYPIHCVK